MTMSPATRLHLVIAGAYVLLFATYAIIIWRSWLTVPKVRVAAVVPNEADAVVVGLFSAGASSASSASAASAGLAMGASAPGAAAAGLATAVVGA